MPDVCYKWWGWNFIFLNLLKNERSMIHISHFILDAVMTKNKIRMNLREIKSNHGKEYKKAS